MSGTWTVLLLDGNGRKVRGYDVLGEVAAVRLAQRLDPDGLCTRILPREQYDDELLDEVWRLFHQRSA